MARPLWTVALLGIVVLTVNLLWVAHHRPLGTFDADEAGYLTNSLAFHRSLMDGLLSGPSSPSLGPFLDRVGNTTTGPLLPIVGIPFVLLGSRTVIWLMAAPALMQVVSAVAVAGITSVLSTSRRALVAGIVVLGLPGAIASARSFVFAGTAGAMLALAVWALVSSDRGRRTSAMIGFGGAVGLMLLARTMTVAFLPALVVAAATYGARDRRVVRNVALAGAACCAVAAPWGWVARERISDNLLRYGYSDLSGSVT